MISPNSEHICLLELVKASLFDLSPVIPQDTDWERVFDAAKSQCIVPLLASSIPSEHKKAWLGFSYQSRAHFIQLNYEQDYLINLFKDEKIPLVILKGTAAAIYFPNPSLRTFGDVDFYTSSEFLDRARNLLENNGFIFLKDNENEYVYEKNGISFELHIKITGRYYNDVEEIIRNGLNNAVEYRIGSSLFPGLPTYENGIALLGHIMHHLKTYGIGLRQIIDWMMYVHNMLNDAAWKNHFCRLAKAAGLEKLAITVTYMCKKWLGLTDKITWCNTADENVADQLLVRILNDGNFGCDRAPYENLSISFKNEGLFTHLQSFGLAHWRLAQKYAILRPFAWIYQLFRYICLGIASLCTGKKVFKKDKEALNIDNLLEKLE